MAFSTSGSSPNVVKAVEFARSAGMTTAALTGAAGGRLAELADHVVKVPDDHVGRVEDAHLILAHMICYAFAEGAA
jgi:D-sedoheptulose 7-phosphate isomerase